MNTTPDILSPLDEQQRKRRELRSVITMSVPIVITTCSRMLMDLADFKMVSYLGDEAQGAMMPAQITMWTFIVLGFGTVCMVNTFVSQSLGRGRQADTTAYTWQGVYMALAYGTVALAVYPVLPAVFAKIGHSSGIQELELAYARVGLLTIGPTIAAEALASFFNGVHRPRVTMWSAIEANVINVAVSVCLIFGLLGLPALGIAGAAWGTLVGVVYRFGRLLSVFLSREYGNQFGARQTWRLDATKIRAIVRVGLPQGLQWTSDVLVWAIFVNILVGRMFGDVHLIASNVAWQYLRIAFMPSLGVGIALSALVGKAVGQQDHGLAIRMTRISVSILVVYLAVLSLVYLVFRESLIGWFNDAPEVVRIASAIMICAVVFQIFDGLGIAYNAALRGAGDTFWPAALFVISHWVIVVGGGWFVATRWPHWGSVGPWAAATFLIVFLGVALWWRWHSRAWQRMDIFKHEKDAPAGAGDSTEDTGPVGQVEGLTT